MNDYRLSVSGEGLNAIDRIDSLNYFCLGNKGELSTQRTDLYILAVSMGIGAGKIPFKKAGKAIIREASVDTYAKNLLTALYAYGKSDDDLLGIADIGNVFDNSSDYANAGLMLLGEYANSKPDITLMYEWINELNSEYEKLFPEDE